jgi:hypothetical protein
MAAEQHGKPQVLRHDSVSSINRPHLSCEYKDLSICGILHTAAVVERSVVLTATAMARGDALSILVSDHHFRDVGCGG